MPLFLYIFTEIIDLMFDIRILPSIVAMSLSVVSGMAQNRPVKEIRPWDKGPLTVGDFSLINVSKSMEYRVTSHMDAFYQANEEKRKVGNLRFKTWNLSTVMDPMNSWIDAERFDSNVLRYNQVIFDISEAVRRDYQKALDEAGYQKDTVDKYMRVVRSRVEMFQLESAYGQDEVMVAMYEDNVKRELEEKAIVDRKTEPAVPAIKKKRGVNYYFGYDGCILGGNMASYFPSAHGMILGFSYLYKGFSFAIDWRLHAPGFPRDLGLADTKGYEWPADVRATHGYIGLDLGYLLVDSPWISLSAFAGVGADSFYQQKPEYLMKNKKDTESEIDAFGIIGGVEMDFKLLRDLINAVDYVEHSLGLRLYASRAGYRPTGPSWGINFGFFYNFGVFELTR